MNPFNRPSRRKPERPPQPPVRPSADDLLAEMDLEELRDNPSKRKRIKATEDLTIADVRTATEDLEKLRSLFKKELQAEVEKELRVKLKSILRRNPDATIDDYLADEGPEDAEEADDHEDEDDSNAG